MTRPVRTEAQAIEAFWSRVDKAGECWLWTASTNKSLGQMHFMGKMWNTARLSWLIHHKSIPAGSAVLHSCPNSLCVRPDHLFIGSTTTDRYGGADKFWAKVDKSGECWMWTGAKNKGYGMVRRREFNQYQVQAHRYAWFLTHGEWPELFVCHRCDNPSCVNPAHLFLGTAQDNFDDMRSKGRERHRAVRGELQGSAKLTAVKVIRIRKLAAKGLTHQEIADQFGVDRSNISIIVRRKGWAHV